MSDEKKYEVSFFKPLSEHAKANKKLIITLALIWAVGVFGFQFALMIFNEPTPEKSYESFKSVWPSAIEDSVDVTLKQDLSKSILAVLGKNIAVKDNHKKVLKTVLSKTVLSMQADSQKAEFNGLPLETQVTVASASIGLQNEGFDKIMVDLLPTSLIKVENQSVSEENQKLLPEIMELYLVHNQSFLTDTTFLGFPFHYWYTGQFLLILFVVLCLIYAKQIDRINSKYDFVEET